MTRFRSFQPMRDAQRSLSTTGHSFLISPFNSLLDPSGPSPLAGLLIDESASTDSLDMGEVSCNHDQAIHSPEGS